MIRRPEFLEALMPNHRESPLRRVNPSGKVVWVARYTGPDGKRRSAGTFPKQRFAQDAIDAAYDEAERAARPPRTLAEFAETWLALRPRSEHTNATNEQRVSAVIDVVIEGRPLGDWPLRDLRRRHGGLLLGHLLVEQGRAIGGARGIIGVLKTMVNDAIDDELCEGNPFLDLRLRDNDPRATKQKRESRIWTFEQMHAFATAGGQWEPMIRVLCDCGLRLGELLALQRSYLDVPAAELRVYGSAWNGRVMPSSREKQHDRRVPVPPGCLALLRAMPVRIDSPWMFPTPGYVRTGKTGRTVPGGLMWRAENWRRQVWTPARLMSGIDATPQQFRSSWVSNLSAAGIDHADLADIAGHSVETADAHYRRALRRSGDAVRSAIG